MIKDPELPFVDLKTFTPDEIRCIAKQNAREDTGIKEAFLRPMNYHFYNKDKELNQAYKPTGKLEKLVTRIFSYLASMTGAMAELRNPEIINRSMSKLVKLKIDQQFTQGKITDKERIKLIGTAHHMLQDTTAPPHAVPVFHGLALPFSEKNIGKTNGKIILDPVDKWPLTYTPKANQKTFNEVIRIYEEIKKCGYDSPTMFLVEQNSENVKRMLQEKIRLEEGLEKSPFDTWGEFYEQSKHPYFDQYTTIKGKKVNFGDAGLGITPTSYDKFMKKCHKRSVLTSTALNLFILKKALCQKG